MFTTRPAGKTRDKGSGASTPPLWLAFSCAAAGALCCCQQQQAPAPTEPGVTSHSAQLTSQSAAPGHPVGPSEAATASPQAPSGPNVFICGHTHKRRTSTDRVVIGERLAANVVRERGNGIQVQVTTLSAEHYAAVAEAFRAGAFFSLPAQIPSQEECGDFFWLMAATEHLHHRSDKDSTDSAAYEGISDGCAHAFSQPTLTWRQSSLDELEQLIDQRVSSLSGGDHRAQLLNNWLEHLKRGVEP